MPTPNFGEGGECGGRERGDSASKLKARETDLIEVLQDDGNVHVDDDQEHHHDVGHHEGDGQPGDAAVPEWWLLQVAIRQCLVVRVAVGLRDQQPVQDVVPACRGGQANQQQEAVAECLEVGQVIERSIQLDVSERRHADDGIDVHDQEEQRPNVEDSREGDDEGEKQLADSLGCLDEAQHSADAEDANHTQQGGFDDDAV